MMKFVWLGSTSMSSWPRASYIIAFASSFVFTLFAKNSSSASEATAATPATWLGAFRVANGRTR